MIEVRNVSKSYGRHRVIDNVSLTISKGAITSFIGPNGAGKSTLLSLISRLIPMDAGDIFIDNRELRQFHSGELAKKISALRQTNELNLRLTIRDLVSFGRFPYSQGRLTARDWTYVDQAIEYMNLQDIQHKYIGHLSGGQRQAAFIAMIVAQDTDYIMLDEPLNNLDMKHSVEIMKLLRRLVQDFGKGIIIVVHDINFASHYSDYIVALKHGRVVHDGPTETIVRSDRLKDIFDLDIQITQLQEQRVCVYYS